MFVLCTFLSLTFALFELLLLNLNLTRTIEVLVWTLIPFENCH